MSFHTCGPNEALIVSGCCHSRPHMVAGGWVFAWPLIHKVQRISLNSMTLMIESPQVYTQQGVLISVTGVALVKIQGQNADMLRAACEQFLGKTEEQIMTIARETLEGHQRAIISSMTVEDIYKNRKRFSRKMFEMASSDLADMGLTVISYKIKDITDEQGYLKALGVARIAEVKRDARIGEAEAQRDSLIKEALAEQEKMIVKYTMDAEIAKAECEFSLKKAIFDIEIQAKKAEADSSFHIQTAKMKRLIKDEQMTIELIDRSQQIELQDQETKRREKELESSVKKIAEAEKYKIEKLAEAHRKKMIAEASAQSQSIKLLGAAESYSIEVKAKADTEQLARKANAYKEYNDAAKIDMILETLPKLTAEVAAPLANCKKITMISSGDGSVGVTKLTDEVFGIVNNVNSMVTGFSVPVNLRQN
ncbi:flotillin-1-like [Panonychus citri]|uniref:flotillin-1-like n=1 Tax=Panonychus citri TaxID=50023 RepID=UPI0023074151|nr:flotillin-1-like [Panonychus citri]